MANYCNNYISIKGSASEIQRLLRDGKSESHALDFDRLHPRPNDDLVWQNENWGCSDPSVLEFEDENEESLSTNYDTRWAPPIEAFTYLSAVYNLEFALIYEELGSGFCGIARMSQGIVEDSCWNSLVPDPNIQLTKQEMDNFKSLANLTKLGTEYQEGECVLVARSATTKRWSFYRPSSTGPFKFDFESGDHNFADVLSRIAHEDIDYIYKLCSDEDCCCYWHFERTESSLFKNVLDKSIFDAWIRQS